MKVKVFFDGPTQVWSLLEFEEASWWKRLNSQNIQSSSEMLRKRCQDIFIIGSTVLFRSLLIPIPGHIVGPGYQGWYLIHIWLRFQVERFIRISRLPVLFGKNWSSSKWIERVLWSTWVGEWLEIWVVFVLHASWEALILSRYRLPCSHRSMHQLEENLL